MLSTAFTIIAAVSFAVYLTFKYYEPSNPIVLVTLIAIVPGFLVILTAQLAEITFAAAFLSAYIAYFTLIFTYTAVYRLSPFHPLARYPGPIAHYVSKFYNAWITSKGKQHTYYKQLHERYGDIVRTGPNQLSIRCAEAIQTIHVSDGTMKGPFWDNRQSAVPELIAVRDPVEHSQRRKAWNRAFSSAGLKNFEDGIVTTVCKLIACLEVQTGEVLDLTMWTTLFAYDYMGDMAFDKDFGLLQEGRDALNIHGLISDGMHYMSITGHVPWLLPFLKHIPVVANANTRVRNFAAGIAKHRLEAGSTKKDLFFHLIDEDGVDPVKPSTPVIVSDGVLAVVAGSDTIAAALSALWYFLLQHRDVYARLQQEIDAMFPATGSDPAEFTKMSHMEYLNACIHEALRLIPPVPSGAQRIVCAPEGIIIKNNHIPTGSHVLVHTYSLHRDPRYFSPCPDTFWPDRWLPAATRTVLPGVSAAAPVVTNAAAFIPFSAGATVCAGKNIALMELRAVVCAVLQRFEIRTAKGAEPEVAGWENTVMDYFTVKFGNIPVHLTARVTPYQHGICSS